MKKSLIEWIKVKGVGYTEIVIPMVVEEDVQFDSIEWIPESNQVILHKFVGDEWDYEIDWDELPKSWQLEIFKQLITPFMN
jgi:hypothetical protein